MYIYLVRKLDSIIFMIRYEYIIKLIFSSDWTMDASDSVPASSSIVQMWHAKFDSEASDISSSDERCGSEVSDAWLVFP